VRSQSKRWDELVLSETVRYLATGGLGATLCTGIVRLVSLKMRINFNRHVVDRACEQGQHINPTEIINAATPRTRYHHPIEAMAEAHERLPDGRPVQAIAPSTADASGTGWVEDAMSQRVGLGPSEGLGS
jgi:hypothetical protein